MPYFARWLLLAFVASQSWRDPSPHTVRFVEVEKNVRLEVLDWGGRGRPLILLAGGGNTAHVFDEFAPKLARTCHVYGITRRGFGASGFSSSDNWSDRLRDDVAATIDALKLNKPVLVGHSIAGAELSAVATAYPDRVAGLVYLEAAYPYAFDDGQGPAMKEFQSLGGPQAPAPSPSGLASFSALRKWDADVFGIRMPESEFHQTWEPKADGQVGNARDFAGSQALMAIMAKPAKHASIPVPALAMFAIPHVPEKWISESADPAVRERARAYFTKLDALAEKQARAFETGVPGARVIRLPGAHYIFLSNEREVVRGVRAFIQGLE